MSEDQGKAGEPLPATVKPPFDLEQFARETDTKLVLEGSPASGRPTAPPRPAVRRAMERLRVDLEALAREGLITWR